MKAAARAERAAKKEKAKEGKEQVKSLAKMAEAKILKDLSTSLRTHARSATFACGGSVSFKAAVDETAEEANKEPIQQEINKTNIPKADKTEPPSAVIDEVQVRFGATGEGSTVIFNNDGPSSHDFAHLLKACQPASFGRFGEAVLDKDYRKAGKLDRSQFATSFCPYEAGIIDVVTQLLVPQYKHGRHTRSIKAELYKLNVYSAPNGKFKPHVDTPRSKDQIGSLVVSLPSAHQGGQLTVSNASTTSQNVVFDWSATDKEAPAEIKWAAFYSDCKHEVHEVTSGHRVTLTYNLFLTRGVGHLAGASPALDSTQLPLYEGLQDALENPGFLRRGRVLAMYLTHCYAHTSAHVNFLPDSLKGADMSLWNTAQALGLKCQVVPVMPSAYPSYREERADHLYEPKFGAFDGQSSGGFEDMIEPSWGHGMPKSKMTWLNGHTMSSACKEVQMAYMTYGNQPGLDIKYTRAVMLIRIPPYHERDSGKANPKSIWKGINLDPTDYKESGTKDDEMEKDEGEYDEDEDEDEDEDGDEGS